MTTDPLRAVQRTPEWDRINQLPWRSSGGAEGLAEALSNALRRPHGQQTLRQIQAWALHEIYLHGGLLAPIRCGHGKTLISLLAPLVLGSQRPLLLLPAKLIEKTRREMRLLSVHWPIPNHIRIMSYEALGRMSAAEYLRAWAPDLIVADECHRLKSRSTAVTRRVARVFADDPSCKGVFLSGTLTKRSLKDFAHLATWALKPAGSPLPNSWGELTEWADCVDESFRGDRPMSGALAAWAPNPTAAALGDTDEVRRGFHARLTSTPGVVASTESRIGTSLLISSISIHESPVVREAFAGLRERWDRPDGEPMVDGASVWRVARELALGFYYRWDPEPPPAWREARRQWAKLCRYLIAENRRQLDSELQIKHAIRDGYYPSHTSTLREWEDISPTFKPNSVPVWICDKAIVAASAWASAHHGIVWTEHTAFAKRLAKHACLSYYGAGGLDSHGRPIEMHVGASFIASSDANAEGRNLQKWHENLETSPAPNGLQWEQKLARTHRDGQEADQVTFDVFFACAEHVSAFDAALADARYTLAVTGHEQKILYADKDIADCGVSGPVWDKEWGS